jgi:RNA polymerase-binding transcription factor
MTPTRIGRRAVAFSGPLCAARIAEVAQPSIDLAAARRRLSAERARLLADLGEPVESPGQMTYGSQAAAASHVFEQQRDLALRDQARTELAQVEAALARIEDGSYGTCRSCGGTIAEGRLEAIPWVSVCIECARKGAR